MATFEGGIFRCVKKVDLIAVQAGPNMAQIIGVDSGRTGQIPCLGSQGVGSVVKVIEEECILANRCSGTEESCLILK